MPPVFLHCDGDTVVLKENYPSLGLRAGAPGVIWVSYRTTPPACDVTFRGADGRDFDMVVDEGEITDPAREWCPQ